MHRKRYAAEDLDEENERRSFCSGSCFIFIILILGLFVCGIILLEEEERDLFCTSGADTYIMKYKNMSSDACAKFKDKDQSNECIFFSKCVKCPPNAKCSKGIIEDCLPGFEVESKQRCVLRQDLFRKVEHILAGVAKQLKNATSSASCFAETKAQVLRSHVMVNVI